MLALVFRILLVRLNVRCAILPDFPLYNRFFYDVHSLAISDPGLVSACDGMSYCLHWATNIILFRKCCHKFSICGIYIG